MCGRYTLFQNQEDADTRFLHARLRQRFPEDTLPAGDIFPGSMAPVYLPHQGKARLAFARWGFPNPYRKGLIINARAETAGEKKLFRASLHSMRCAVPCNSFYEWSAQKEPYSYTLPQIPLFYLAGLFTHAEDGLRFLVLTVPANSSVALVHGRMPLLLQKGNVRSWLFHAQRALELMGRPMPPLQGRPLCASETEAAPEKE